MLKCLIVATLVYTCGAFKVLVVFPAPTKSHSILGDGVVRLLLAAGHEVTYITPLPKKQSQKNLTQVDVSGNVVSSIIDSLNIKHFLVKKVEATVLIDYFHMLLQLSKNTVNQRSVQELLRDPNQHFDVVISEWLVNEYNAGYSATFNCPNIWIYPQETHWLLLSIMDEIVNPAFVADPWSTVSLPMTFLERMQSLVNLMWSYINKECFFYYYEKREYEKSFVPIIRKRGLVAPEYADLRINSSLVLNNWHSALGQWKKTPPNSIDVAGYHIEENIRELPLVLQDIMNNSRHGVIYFSLGSILKSNDLPESLTRDLLDMFSKLKYDVLWKFEKCTMDMPYNVHVLPWAPQQSILAHPKCILFITHGGLLSLIEAVHFAVPVIGIPIFGDHFGNIGRSVRKGFAKRVDLSYNIANDLNNAITDILENKSYKQAAKEVSLIYHDRLVPPGRELVHWVEHVVKTRGAPHLRSPALMLSWYQKMYLDLALAIFLYCSVVVLIGYYTAKYMLTNKVKELKKRFN